jgi:hypothetical protein
LGIRGEIVNKSHANAESGYAAIKIVRLWIFYFAGGHIHGINYSLRAIRNKLVLGKNAWLKQ